LTFDPIQKKSAQKWAKNTWLPHTFADLSPLLTGLFFAPGCRVFCHGKTWANPSGCHHFAGIDF
jgi:hypothetical protein